MNKVTLDMDRFIDDWVVFMKDHNMSQKEFSELSGISTTKISRMVNRISVVPDLASVELIAGIIDVLIEDYVVGNGCVMNIDAVDLDSLSIEELDRMINKLKAVRHRKIKDELTAVRSREAELITLLDKEDDIYVNL